MSGHVVDMVKKQRQRVLKKAVIVQKMGVARLEWNSNTYYIDDIHAFCCLMEREETLVLVAINYLLV